MDYPSVYIYVYQISWVLIVDLTILLLNERAQRLLKLF